MKKETLSMLFQKTGQVVNFMDFQAAHKLEINELFSQQAEPEHKRRHLYYYDGEYFDSANEVAFFISKKIKGYNIIRNHKVFFEYTEACGKQHKYYPDFIEKSGDKDTFYEVKGIHLFKNGKLSNPFDKKHKYTAKDAAKTKCMLDNGVNVILNSDDEIKELKDQGIDVFSFRKDMSWETCAKRLWIQYKKLHPNCNRAQYHKPKVPYFPNGVSVQELGEMLAKGIKPRRSLKINFICCSCGQESSVTYRRAPLANLKNLECKSCNLKKAFSTQTLEDKELKRQRQNSTFAKNHPGMTLGKFLAEKVLEKYDGDRAAFDAKCTEGRRKVMLERYGVASCWAHVNCKNKGENNEKNQEHN